MGAVQTAGYVGSQSATAGSTTTAFRQDLTGAQVVSLARGARAEQVRLGQIFAAFIPPGTGQAPGTAIGTTGAFTLALASGVSYRLVLLKLMVGYISGTLGAGTLALLAHFSASGSITAPTGGTAITPTNALLGSNTSSQANCRFNNTVPASGLMIRAIGNLQASLASTAVAPWALIDNIDGEVIIGAGQAVSIQGIAAAGSSPLITVGAIWAEEPT